MTQTPNNQPTVKTSIGQPPLPAGASPGQMTVPDAGLGANGPVQGLTPAQQTMRDFVVSPPPPKKTKVQPTSQQPTTTPAGPELDDLMAGNSPARKVADKANEEASAVRSSGALLIAIIVLIVLIWLLIPTASGYTRLQLAWFTLLQKTKLVNTGGPVPQVTGQGPTQQQVEQTQQSSQVASTGQPQSTNYGNAPLNGAANPDLSILFNEW
jgi:hypothetical protein